MWTAAADAFTSAGPRGFSRNQKVKPLVGDDVEFTIVDEKDGEGNIDAILPRKNELIRPAAANIDQALVVFALSHPAPNLNLLDRFLVMMERQKVPVTICFNKADLEEGEGGQELTELPAVRAYRQAGYRVLCVSALNQQGIEEIQELLKGKTTVFAGPSGVGKSTLTNAISAPRLRWKPARSAARFREGSIPPAILSCFVWERIPT